MTQNIAKNIIGNVASSYQVNLAIEIPNITENYINSHVFTCRHWVSAMLITQMLNPLLRSAVAGRIYKLCAKNTSNSGFDRTFMPCSCLFLCAAEQRAGYQISWVNLQREAELSVNL